LDNRVAPIELGDDVDVRLESQKRDEGAADHVHVFGDEHADHVNISANTGTSTRSRNRPSPSDRPVASPDSAAARDAIPLRPLPPVVGGIAPSFRISNRTTSFC